MYSYDICYGTPALMTSLPTSYGFFIGSTDGLADLFAQAHVPVDLIQAGERGISFAAPLFPRARAAQPSSREARPRTNESFMRS